MKGRKPKPTAIKKQDGTADPWRNRIVGQGDEAPDQLLANPSNWRIHPTAQREALAAVLDDVGWVQRVIVNRTTQHVVDGHLRVALALSRDEPTIPVNYVELDEREEALVLAALDPIAAMATTDKNKLRELLEQAQVTDEALRDQLNDVAGMTAALKEGETDPDAVPDERATKIQRGDLFALGDHRLLCGDCTEADDVARLMNGTKAQMIFTDPPYGVNYDGGLKKRKRLKNDHQNTDIYGQSLPVLERATDDQSSIYLWYADGHAAAAAAAAAGYEIVCQIIWAKNHAQFVTSAHYKGKHEPCFHGHKKNKTARWFGANNEVTLWEYSRSSSNDYHPTQKPVAIAVRAIGNSTAHMDIILDGFIGGGTTMIAAEQLGRRCYAIEIEPTYCQVTIDRWEAFTGEKAKKVQP